MWTSIADHTAQPARQECADPGQDQLHAQPNQAVAANTLVSWIGAMSEEFHPSLASLLPNFYLDIVLVMRYMNDSNRLKKTQQPQQQEGKQQTQQSAMFGQHAEARLPIRGH